MRLIYTQLLKGIRGVSLTVLRYSPARDDIDIIIDVEVLENVLRQLAVDGHILSVIRSDLDLHASDGEFAETSPELQEPGRILDSYRGADTGIDSSVIVPVDGDIVVTGANALRWDHVELATCTLGLEVNGLVDRSTHEAIAWSSSPATGDSPLGCATHPRPLARHLGAVGAPCSLSKKSRHNY